MLEMPNRYVYLRYHIDTNRINARQKLDAMNKLESWANDGVIDIEISEVAMNEASSNQVTPRAQKAQAHIFSYTSNSTDIEDNRLKEIEAAIFPEGCKDQNQKNDVEIVFNAGKYGHTLITNDGGSKKQRGGILGAKTALRAIGIKVLRDSEAIEEIKAAIISRDEGAHRVREETELELPEWIGQD